MISLNELAKKAKVNKSKLNYYVTMGLLKADNTMGDFSMMIFDEQKATRVLEIIAKGKKEKLTLTQIKVKYQL